MCIISICPKAEKKNVVCLACVPLCVYVRVRCGHLGVCVFSKKTRHTQTTIVILSESRVESLDPESLVKILYIVDQ